MTMQILDVLEFKCVLFEKTQIFALGLLMNYFQSEYEMRRG